MFHQANSPAKFFCRNWAYNKMKITKSRLKQIIKEELETILEYKDPTMRPYGEEMDSASIKTEPEYQALNRIAAKMDKGRGIDGARVQSLYHRTRMYKTYSIPQILKFIFARGMPTNQLEMAKEEPAFADYGDFIDAQIDSRGGGPRPLKLTAGEWDWEANE